MDTDVGEPSTTRSSWYLTSPFVLDAPNPQERWEEIGRLAGAVLVGNCLLGLMASLLPGSERFLNPQAVGVIALVGLIIGMFMAAFPQLISPIMAYCVLLMLPVLTSVAAYYLGRDQMLLAAMLYPVTSAFCFVWVRRRWAFPVMALIGIGFGIVVWLHDLGATAPMAWIFVMGVVIVVGLFVNFLAQYGHKLALAERAARTETEKARLELANLNAGLQAQVAEQVAQVESLGRLRRLLSPHLAKAIEESDNLLGPHRREVAVLFADLRGFTSFASEVEPEEVVALVEQFYSVVGELAERSGATVGHFEGDGVMLFFNDPLPVPEPAQEAVRLALDMREPMSRLTDRWRRRGFELDYGVGIALGYATLGMVGFEGRQDYTALGTVVNLGARLCDEARGGEILIDRRTALAVEGVVEVETRATLSLKGFRDAVPAFAVRGAKERGTPATAAQARPDRR